MRMTGMALQVVRSDGVLALYNGLSASLCRQVPLGPLPGRRAGRGEAWPGHFCLPAEGLLGFWSQSPQVGGKAGAPQAWTQVQPRLPSVVPCGHGTGHALPSQLARDLCLGRLRPGREQESVGLWTPPAPDLQIGSVWP